MSFESINISIKTGVYNLKLNNSLTFKFKTIDRIINFLCGIAVLMMLVVGFEKFTTFKLFVSGITPEFFYFHKNGCVIQIQF